MSFPNFTRIPLDLSDASAEAGAHSGAPAHLHGLPGFAPFVRGPHPTLYAGADWVIRKDGETTVAAVETEMGRSILIDLAEASTADVRGVAELLTSAAADTVFVGVSGLATASAACQLAEALSAGLSCLRAGVGAGATVDDVASRLGVWLDVGVDYFTDVAKIRAARLVWAETVRREGGAAPGSQALRLHGRIAGADAARATVAAMAATAGQVHSLDVVESDDDPSLRSVPVVVTSEIGLNRVVDPWGGSRHVERLTHELAEQARVLTGGAPRDEAAVQTALTALAEDGGGRMALSIEAGRLGATPSEIAAALGRA